MKQDLLADVVSQAENQTATSDWCVKELLKILLETGEAVGYTPAFRCLVKGLSPEESIRWGK